MERDGQSSIGDRLIRIGEIIKTGGLSIVLGSPEQRSHETPREANTTPDPQ